MEICDKILEKLKEKLAILDSKYVDAESIFMFESF